jgi:hypothetical protein
MALSPAGNSGQPLKVRVVSLRYYPFDVIGWRDFTMMNSSIKLVGIALTAAVLATASAPAGASGQLPIFKACLAKAEKTPDPTAARNQCVWKHWELMAEYG